jgi:hypothetical protein
MSTDPAYAHEELCHGAPSTLRQTTGAGVEAPGPDEEHSQPPDDAITVFDDTDIDIRPTKEEPIADPLLGRCSPTEIDASESPSPALYFPEKSSPTKESNDRKRKDLAEQRGGGHNG